MISEKSCLLQFRVQTCLCIKNTREYTTDPYFLLGAINTNEGKKAKISKKAVEKSLRNKARFGYLYMF